MIENIIHIGTSSNGGITSVVNSYVRLLGLPKENYWSSHSKGFSLSIFETIFVCFKILFDSHKIYHLHTSNRGSTLRKFVIGIFIRFKRKKYIVHLHASDIFKSKFSKKLIKNLLLHSSAIICITKDMKIPVVENTQIKDNIFVIPNLSETIAELPTDLTNREKPVKIVYCGTFVKNKGIFDLVNAFEKAKFDNPVTLDLFGSGNPLKIQKENINVCGWVEHGEYLRLLPNYDFLVLPSYMEVFPMSILEAMGIGLPVIGTYAGGMPEMIENDKNGIIFKAGNIDELTRAMERLANDKKLRIELGGNSWEKVKREYAPNIIKKMLEEVYARI